MALATADPPRTIASQISTVCGARIRGSGALNIIRPTIELTNAESGRASEDRHYGAHNTDKHPLAHRHPAHRSRRAADRLQHPKLARALDHIRAHRRGQAQHADDRHQDRRENQRDDQQQHVAIQSGTQVYIADGGGHADAAVHQAALDRAQHRCRRRVILGGGDDAQ